MSRKKGKRRQARADRRRAAGSAKATRSTAETAPSATLASPSTPAEAPRTAPAPAPPAGAGGPIRHPARWLVAGVAVLLLVTLVVIRLLPDSADAEATSDATEIVVGTPGGAVLGGSPEPTSTEPEQPPATPAPSPTPMVAAATPIPATPAATPTPAAATPAPATPVPATPVAATPVPTPVVVAVADPADAVAAFYRSVTDGRFDVAYALWSDRMKATYPRQENLDDRFASTAAIRFQQLSVVERTDRAATVQANFTETYDGGSSRRFIGYWELIRVGGRWLLDAPHY